MRRIKQLKLKRKQYNRLMKTMSIVMVALVLTLAGVLWAKYVSKEEYKDNQAGAKDFYFTVDLLGDTLELDQLEGEYNLYGGGEQVVEFNVQNFFDSLRITEDDVKYKVDVKVENAGSVSYEVDTELKTTTDTTDTFTKALLNTEYTLEGCEKANNKGSAQTWQITMPDGYKEGTRVIVTILSIYPYTKTMTLIYNIHTYDPIVKYRVTDTTGGAYATLTIMTQKRIAANNLNIDWSNVNTPEAGNVLQIDTTNPYVLDANALALGTNDAGDGYLSKIKNTLEIKENGSVDIYFFKTNPNANYATPYDVEVKASYGDNEYKWIRITEGGN